MATQEFKVFYRENGLLTLDSLPDAQPAIIKKLPISSMIHYLGDEESPGLDTSDPLMKGYAEKVVFFNVTAYSDPEFGKPRTPNINTQMSNFLKANRNFYRAKELKDLKTLTQRQLGVIDYSWVGQFSYVAETKLNEFNKTQTLMKTLVDTVQSVNAINRRNHFVVLPVPATLIPKSVLDTKSLETPIRLSTIFYGLDEQLLREMWMFLNPRQNGISIFGKLKHEDLRTINFLFKMYDGKYVILNLGFLLSWVAGNENLTFQSKVNTKNFVDVQKYYLRSLMAMQTFNINGATEAAQEEAIAQKQEMLKKIDESEEEGSELDQRFLQDAEIEASSLRDETRFAVTSTGTQSVGRGTPSAIDAAVQAPESAVTNKRDVDKDIQALEEIQMHKMNSQTSNAKKTVTEEEEPAPYTSEIPDTVESLRSEVFKNMTPQEALLHKLDKLVKEGRISAPEFRKKKELIQESISQLDPYGSGKSVTEAAIVTKEDLVIDKESSTMNVPETVIDKSMATSSLRTLDSKYIDKVLHKDMLAVVQFAQKGGVIIKNHTVDRKTSIHGEYDVHTLEIVPLSGQSSIIRCRLPVVQEDGYYEAKGSKYTLRKQRVDLPIRKIGPNRVGLSSYYGKTFVDRATRKANSQLAFVLNRLSKATITPDEHLREVSPGNVFDNYYTAPYIVSGISEQYQSFNAGPYHIDVDPKGFRGTIDPKVLTQIEVDGTRVVGHTLSGKKSLVICDQFSVFHKFNSDGVETIGDIFDLLQLDRRLAPVDYAEVKIYSKSIPVALYMARQIGFRKLVKLLGATHRIVEGRKPKELQEHEYVVQFKDVAYIFDTRQQVNTLILAGFHAFEKETKLYQAELFDSPEVYMRMLEAKGLNIAYAREMDNLNEMFIDPITERILKEMKEPTTFNGLLIRSCELLKTYYYPASQDLDYQRIRGYDRFPGFMYTELINSIRAFKGKNNTNRAKVDMSPFELWTTITRDSAGKHIEDINPIQSAKLTQEAVTYAGEGGRGKESMNRESRAFLPSDIGIDAGDSVDSSDVGINVFLTANPEFASLDGAKKKGFDTNPGNLLGTSALLAPFSANDD